MTQVELRAGDINGDGLVNINDVTGTVASFGKAVNNQKDDQGRIVDLNGDGVVNINDVTAAVSNFGLLGPLPWP
jgi:Ca2+-binding EF-hand superfamily protein